MSRSRSKADVGRNDLVTTSPEAAALWNPERNESDTAEVVTANTRLVVWWLCPEGHEWSEAPIELVQRGSTCVICANERTRPGVNDLATTHPDLAEQLIPSNHGEQPTDFNAASKVSPDWQCPQGHVFSARISKRVDDPECPVCKEV